MIPPPYCSRLPAGSYSFPQNPGISALDREPRGGYTNQAFVPSAPPPPYDEFLSDCHEIGLPRYSSLSHPLPPPVPRPSRTRCRSPSINLFILWVAIILIPTVILVGILVIVLISTE